MWIFENLVSLRLKFNFDKTKPFITDYGHLCSEASKLIIQNFFILFDGSLISV